MQNEKPGKLRNLNLYMTKALKFYDLKNENLSRFIFLVILVVNFLGIFVPENVYLDIIFNLIRVAIIILASAAYLTVYIRELKGQTCGMRECFRITGKNALKILAASISFIIAAIATFGVSLSVEALAVAISMLGIPLLVIYLMFIFNVCYVVDLGKGVAESYAASKRITYGYKRAIFFVILLFNFIVAIPLSFLMIIGMTTNNDLVFVFVVSFATSVISIMQNRLTALLYIDLEYGDKESDGQYHDNISWQNRNKDNNHWYDNRYSIRQYENRDSDSKYDNNGNEQKGDNKENTENNENNGKIDDKGSD